MNSSQSQLLLAAFSHASQLACGRVRSEQGKTKLLALQAQLDYKAKMGQVSVEIERERGALERHRLDVQADLAKTLIHALIEKRVDALQAAFLAISGQYDAQAQHYMTEKERMAEAQCTAQDAVQRASYQERLMDIDACLSRIRRDYQRLFRAYTTCIQQFGGTVSPLRLMDGNNVLLGGNGP